ncbi:MAG: ATP-binding protein [Proteobacteria bacterium]|nr:ATP-binding protein [Pseudomonadota bacterium]
MNTANSSHWIDSNQQALSEELSWLQGLLENANGETAPPPREAATNTAFTLDFLAEQFLLSPFERTIILLCVGIELQSEIATLCSRLQGNSHHTTPSFSLALAILPDAHWSALSPESPLRYWQLIQVQDPNSITTGHLSLDERILHFVLGTGSLDQRLSSLVRPLNQNIPLPPSQHQQVVQLTGLWRNNDKPPLILIQGNDAAAGREVAAQSCAALGLQLLLLRAEDIPLPAEERSQLARLLTREHLLAGIALIIEISHPSPPQLTAFMERLDSPLMLLAEQADSRQQHSTVIEVNKPTAAEQRSLWRSFLADCETFDTIELFSLVAQFDFAVGDITTIAEIVASEAKLGTPLKQALWQNCRQHSRGDLGHLAQRIPAKASEEDLILPRGQKSILEDISRQVRHRATVYETWGFAAKSDRGLGISALFAGPSGTGKTLAAEVLANSLNLDLYRIDLSTIVSKYIGETEKNLERLFRAAESSGAILLFDEADALFGKRSAVKDSHDRYANMELAYLLQRMESYRGLSILTSNMKSALDTAFLRRIRFVVQFPFPDVAQRDEIWRGVFPDNLPRAKLNTEYLARLHVTGGNIRNIAMNAAFLAAEKGDPLCMADLAHAARMEYAKLEKPLNENELRKWI